MKRRARIRRVLSSLIAILLIFSFCSCGRMEDGLRDWIRGMIPSKYMLSQNPAEEPKTTEETVVPEPTPQNTFTLSENFVLVYSEFIQGTTVEENTVEYLAGAVEAACGFAPVVLDDVTAPTPTACEIIIGDTNRTQSKNVMDTLGVLDYTYFVESKNVIVICGGSLSATQAGVEKFCEDVLGYTKEHPDAAKKPELIIGTEHTHKATYEYETATFNTVALSNWTIAVGQGSDALQSADAIMTRLGMCTGERVKMVAAEQVTGSENYLISVGGVGRLMTSPNSAFVGDYYSSVNDTKGKVLSFYSTEEGLCALADYFSGKVVTTKSGTAARLSVPNEVCNRGLSNGNLPAYWRLQSETTETLYKGVTYVEQVFYDEDNLPYHTYALILDPANVEFYVGTSNDGYDLAPTSSNRQTTMQHMNAAVQNGLNIIAGVNANFFYIDTDYSPKGLVLKNGRLINSSYSDYPFFAITDTGEMIIDQGSTYSSYVSQGKNFVQGVAGNALLLKNGMLTDRALEPGQGPHPRTLVGLTKDGKVVIGVIDGRQTSISNGAGYARSAFWMRSLGADTVINLDGGGSSNLILRNQDTNRYQTCNVPSDGGLRKVYNSLLIALK